VLGKRLIGLLLIVLLTGQIFAAQTDYIALMEQANAAYQGGNYQEAIRLYQNILQEGVISGELCYNLGNAYFRLGDMGRAILYYERAQRLLPRSESVSFNLRLANFYIKDRIDVPPPFFLYRWYQHLTNSLTARGWGFLFSLLLFLSALLILGYHFIELKFTRVMKKIAILLAVGGLVVLTPFISRYNYEANSHEAIVISPVVTCLAAPQPGSTELFVVHSGTKVKVLGSDGEWYKIELLDGKQGWAPQRDVEKI
jgi:tetratricopeptide (TPR) repeat protein